MEFLKSNWEGIVAIAALFTSVVATFISYRLLSIKQKHFEKSVRPMLQIGQWDYENCLKVDLRNAGIGPAIVKEIEVFKNKHEKKTCIYHWLPKKLPGEMNYKEYWTANENFVVKTNGVIQLIEIHLDPLNEEQKICREEIRGILRQLTVRVVYYDFYDNKIEDKSMKLNLFSRVDNEN